MNRSWIRSFLGMASVALAVSLVSADSDAKKKLQVPASLHKHAGQTEHDGIDPNETYTLPNGKKATAQQVADMYGDAHVTHDLTKLGDEDLDPDTKKKVNEDDEDHEKHAKQLAEHKPKKNSKKGKSRAGARKHKKDKKAKGGGKGGKQPGAGDVKRAQKSVDKFKFDGGGGKGGDAKKLDLHEDDDEETPKDCTDSTCEPYSKKNHVGWSRELGDAKIVSAYTSFDIDSKHPSAHQTGCNVSWDNGLHLVKKKISILKFTASGMAEIDKTASFGGHAKFDVLGKTVWQADGDVKSKELSRQFRTPTVGFTYSFYQVINISAEIDAGATVGLIPTSMQESDGDGVECTITVKPGLTTDVTGKLSISIGPKGLFELVKGGIGVRIIPIEVGLPTTLGVEVDQEPPSIDLIFKMKFEVSLLKGQVFLFYDLWDTCKNGKGFCLVKDVLKIKTHGEKSLYKSKKGAYSYEKELAHIDQKLNFKKIASGKGGGG